MPAGVFLVSIAVNTLRPKKNGKPQSKFPADGPPRFGNTLSPPFANNVAALSIVKLTVLLVPFEPRFKAERLSGDDGQ